MARKHRYFTDDDEKGVTPSQLRRMGRERQKEYMLHWFHRNFEDPVHETPYNSREGGYLFVWGGPYDAREELSHEFESIIAEDRIEEVIDELEADGDQWAPGPDHPDTRQREEDWRSDQDERENEANPPPVANLDQIIEQLKSGTKPSYGDGFELEQRRIIREQLDALKSALMQVAPAHGGMGHNNPPPDDESPQAAVVSEVRDAEETISRELAKPEPDALEVAVATSRLKAALGWLGKKLDTAADSFAKAFGTALGTAVATSIAVAVGAAVSPPFMQLIVGIIQQLTGWLSHVTSPI